MLKETIRAIESFKFEIWEDKVPLSSPWTYLGFQLREETVVHQQIFIKDDPKMLHDLQPPAAVWLHQLGMSSAGNNDKDLTPLLSLLQGNEDLTSPQTISPEARKSFNKVQEVLSWHTQCFEPSLLFFIPF